MVREVKKEDLEQILNLYLSIQSSINPVFSRLIAY